MEALIEILENPTWQAFVFSPLASVLFSMLLLPQSSGAENAFTVKQAVNSYNTINSYNNINSHNRVNVYANGSTNPAGDFTMAFALVAPAAYLHFAPQVLHWAIVAAIFAVTMSVVLVVRAISIGAIADPAWILRLFLPPVIAVFIILVSNSALSIYYAPTGSGWQWTVFQALGIFCMCASLLTAWLSLINSACQLGHPDLVRTSQFRMWAIEATTRYARPTAMVVAVIFVTAAPLLINGRAAEWLLSLTSGG